MENYATNSQTLQFNPFHKLCWNKGNRRSYLPKEKTRSTSSNELLGREKFSDIVRKLKAKEKLDIIRNLEYNWNGNNAKPFSDKHINIVRRIVDELSVIPFISPTASNSIQLEYEKSSGEYLEFEVFENGVNIFTIDSAGQEEEVFFKSIEYNEFRNRVDKFYE